MAHDDLQSSDRIDILLVEPNPGDTRLFTESFREAKLTNYLHSVDDGAAALDFVNQRGAYADKPCPDLILLEPQLPGTGGREILSALNNDQALCDIPVVILTGSAVEEEIAKAHGIEADHYIQKPVEPDEFIEFVQSVEDFWLAIVQEPATSE